MANDSVASSELESLSHHENEKTMAHDDPDISLVTVDKNQMPRRTKRHDIVHLPTRKFLIKNRVLTRSSVTAYVTVKPHRKSQTVYYV